MVLQIIPKVLIGTLSVIASLAVSTVTNGILMAVILVRFVVMTLLRSLSSTVTFVGESTLNAISFIRDTVFSVLTFIVQTVTSLVLFTLNQFLAVWRLVVTLVTVALGETCYLGHKTIDRVFDAFGDIVSSLAAFSSGPTGLIKVLKAQAVDIKSGVGVKAIIKQALLSFKNTLVYILMGDEKTISDGLVPNVFVEVFRALPLSFDLAKLILTSTFDISKETLSTAFSSLVELTSLAGILEGCRGTAS